MRLMNSGLDESRTEYRHPDVRAHEQQLLKERLRKPHDGELGRAVGPMPGAPPRPASDAVLTTCPSFCSMKTGTKALSP